MAFLTYNGTTLPCNLNTVTVEPEIAGEEIRAHNNDLHDTKRSHKIRIEGVCPNVDTSTIGGVITALKLAGSNTAGGDLITRLVADLGISTSFTARLGRVSYRVYQGGVSYWVNFTLREV